jgi:hypothetical protein
MTTSSIIANASATLFSEQRHAIEEHERAAQQAINDWNSFVRLSSM